MTHIRRAAVAGMFYPGSAKELAASVRYYLAQASDDAAAEGPVPKAIIAPHAGYIYSGRTAAAAYNRLKPAAKIITRVVMMGPCHRVAVRGLALSGADAFSTPLGDIPVDKEACARILDLPQVEVFDETHKDDHSLEVHLPFLQVVLDEFSIVPMIVGQATAEEVAAVLEALWGGPETLILISSDLSHYLSHAEARRSDAQARKAIEALDPLALGDEMACGRHSIKGLLTVARAHGLRPVTLDLRNSGDTAGPKDRVVGYGSWMFVEGGAPTKPATAGGGAAKSGAPKSGAPKSGAEDDFAAKTRALLNEHGAKLLAVAARSIETYLAKGQIHTPNVMDFPAPLADNGACFVTLEKEGALRGCIGSLAAHRPLVLDVADNAFRAAFKDPRFGALEADEYAANHIGLSVTVLSHHVPIEVTGEEALIQSLRPGIDGLILHDGKRRSVFLPQVWESLPDPREFVNHLKRKAGWAGNYWSADIKAFRFVTESVAGARAPGDGWKVVPK